MALLNISDDLLSALESQYPGLFSTLLNSGVQPTAPDDLRNELINRATARAPGLTANLPGTLIEDMASTAVGALAQADQMKVDQINSVSPLNANAAWLDQFGEIYGVKRGAGANPSAYVTFIGTPGLFLGKGFQVSDGTHIYETQKNVTLPSDGTLGDVYVLAVQPGKYVTPAHSITQIVSNYQNNASLTVTNPQPATVGSDPESDSSSRARILQAGQATTQGTPNFIKTCIQAVPNVIPRSVSVPIITDNANIPLAYRVTADGGDPQQIAGAIYESCFDLLTLQGSVNALGSATQDDPCTITTTLTHGLTSGQTVSIDGATGMTAINGEFTATVLDAYRFTIPVDTRSSAPYSGGGVLLTNDRNIMATVQDGADSYPITFVRPLQQNVRLVIFWQTSAVNILDNEAAGDVIAPQLADYINNLAVNEPINILQLNAVFESSLLELIPSNQITRLHFDVYIDGILTPPEGQSTVILGDPESYFVTSSDHIRLERG
ncbi:hypothetical protein GS501_04515 [Saccharibacter sp. 17.LH.SD]|uniref:baseplate J/gp47 family protein n=1 Tax=Saccharibacter sp. 17.LH.SD TaxID=2689393 RepID=UPI00136B962F|nr:baseplate J/gp47 family protein [Saccharibacter sp. 17.LH.SD]MXV44308.1 hypothetical protein [Saccharibacter sp. 17.LH.SD]